MKKIPIELRNSIIHALGSSTSDRMIALEFGVGRTTVGRIRKEICGKTPVPQKKGRPRKLTMRDEQWTVRQIKTGKTENATSLSKQLKERGIATVSPKTVRRTLKRAGLKALVKQKKPKLINRHVKALYEFAVK